MSAHHHPKKWKSQRNSARNAVCNGAQQSVFALVDIHLQKENTVQLLLVHHKNVVHVALPERDMFVQPNLLVRRVHVLQASRFFQTKINKQRHQLLQSIDARVSSVHFVLSEKQLQI